MMNFHFPCKLYQVLFILSTFAFSCREQHRVSEEQTALQQAISTQHIHYLITYEYLYKDHKIDSNTRFLQKREQYDKRGNLITSVSYAREPEFKNSTDSIVYLYDNDNLTLQFTVYAGKKLQSVCKFDNNGGHSEMRCYNSDNQLIYTQKPRYNGNIKTGEKTYDKDGILEDSSKLIPINKTTLKWIKYNRRGVLEAQIVTEQNRKGLKTKEQYYLADTKTTSIYKYTYNDQNISATVTKYNADMSPVVFYKIMPVKF